MASRLERTYSKHMIAKAKEMAIYWAAQGKSVRDISAMLLKEIRMVVGYSAVSRWVKKDREPQVAKPKKPLHRLEKATVENGGQEAPAEATVETGVPWRESHAGPVTVEGDLDLARDVTRASMIWHAGWAEVVEGNENKSNAYVRAVGSAANMLKLCEKQIELDQFKGIRVRKGSK